MLTELVAFVPVAAVVICTPGPDTALTVRRAEQQDEHPGRQPEPARPRQRRPPHTPSGRPGPTPAT